MDIGSLLRFIAVALLAVGFLGVALTFTLVSQSRPARGGVLLAAAGFILGVIFFILGSGIVTIVPARAGVVINVLTGELEDPPRAAGTSIIIPGIQEVVIYPVDQQEYTMSGLPSEGRVQGNDSVQALTVDGQNIFIDMTVIYRIDRENANTIHLSWQNRYEDDFIRPTVRAIARDVVSRFEAEAIYGADRESMQTQIETRLEARMLEEGLTLSDLLVRQIRFDEEFATSIEEKQIEEQKLQRARTEATRVETEAGGRAASVIAESRGEAEAILIRAQADAEALRLISDQIAANPNLISYLYVQNLSDNINLALIPSNSPFLFDLNSFESLGEDFVAPPVPDVILPETGSSDSGG